MSTAMTARTEISPRFIVAPFVPGSWAIRDTREPGSPAVEFTASEAEAVETATRFNERAVAAERAARINAGAVTQREADGGTLVTIGGIEVRVRVAADGRLRVWVEAGGTDAELVHPETECTPLVLGVEDSTVFATDVRGLGAESDVFPTA